MEARFIKEHDISADSIKNLDQINFVPETVKNRFADVLKTAPDWNISRNRYRGSPLPIRESKVNTENRIII
jgi:isoleucyl-tRNA synthetase